MTEMVRITGGPISATSEDSPGVVFHGYEYDK